MIWKNLCCLIAKKITFQLNQISTQWTDQYIIITDPCLAIIYVNPCQKQHQFQLFLLLLFCIWPPFRVVCPNHEVVVFQPWAGTAPYLGSVANYTSCSNPPAPPVSTDFLDLFILPYPTAPPSLALSVVSPLLCTVSPPPLLAKSAVHLDVTRTC